MMCRLYIYAERPASFYANLDFWKLRSLPEGHISADYSFDSQVFGGQINNLQIINDLAETHQTLSLTPGQAALIGGGDQPIDTFYHIPAYDYSFGSYGDPGKG